MTTFRFSIFLRGALLDVKATLRDLHLDLPDGLVQRVDSIQRGFPERLQPETERLAYEAAAEVCAQADRLTRERKLKPDAALELAAEDWSAEQRASYDFDNARARKWPDYQGAPPPWR